MFENIKCLISRKTDKFNLILDPLCDESVSNCDRYNDRKLVEDEEENSEEYTTVNELEGESSRHKYCLNKLQITSKRLDFVDSGTSFVWKRGFSQKYNKEINVKIITSNPDILDDINNEISLWRDLSSERHENLLNILECFENQHFRYVVTHKLDGEISLQKFLVENNRAFSEFQARKVFLGIISAVEFCHGKQVAHRDIKPQHFLVSRNLQVKLSGKLVDIDI